MPSDAIRPFQAMEGKGMGGRVRVSPVVVAQGCHGSQGHGFPGLSMGPRLVIELWRRVDPREAKPMTFMA